MKRSALPAALASLALAACGTAGQNEQKPAYGGLAANEVIRASGTEPFWSAVIESGRLTYTTPEDPRGQTVPVGRFAGNSGLAFNGTLGERSLDLVITQAACSDGMSDRRYPFTATLEIGDETRQGCAYTDRQPFTGPAAP